MRNKSMNLLIAALLVIGVLMAAGPVSAHSDGTELHGLIAAIDGGAGTLTVTPQKGGSDVTLKVDGSTVITRLFHPAALTDLQVGDRVEVKYDPTTLLASRIEAQLNLVKMVGFVSAMDTSTVTVMPKNGGANVILKVDSTTLFTRNGKPATLADIQLGDLVQAKYNPVTLLAARISAQVYLVKLSGIISALGTSTVTVKPKHGGADVVLQVDSTTLIKRNGKPATLAELQLGDKVEAKYNIITLLATKISARPNLFEIKGLISAIDTGAGTLTVTPKKGAKVVLKVDSTTLIKRNGAPATLGDLQVGDRVEAKYNAVS